MTKTTTELADAILKDMAVYGIDETPETAHRTYVTDAYADVWEEINGNGREMVYWPQAEIPLPIFNIMRDLVKVEVQGAFGQMVPDDVREQRRRLVLRRLYKHIAVEGSGLPVKAEYF